METLKLVLGVGVVIVAMFAIAATILVFKDRRESKRLLIQLQARLAARPRCSSEELVGCFPLVREQELAQRLRSRLATALQIDENCIHPDDDLQKDWQLDVINPFLMAAVASEFTHDPNVSGSQQVLSMGPDATKFRDFVRAVSQQSKTL